MRESDELGAALLDVRDSNAPLRARLLKAMADADAWMTIGGIAGQLGMTPESIAGELQLLIEEKLVRHLAQGARGLFKVAKSETPAPSDPVDPEKSTTSHNRKTATSRTSTFNRDPNHQTRQEQRAMPKLPKLSSSEVRPLILAVLKKGPAKSKAIQAQVKCSTETLWRQLKALMNEGFIEKQGTSHSPWQMKDTTKAASAASRRSRAQRAETTKKKPAVMVRPAAPAQRTPAESAADACSFALLDDGRIVIVQDEQAADRKLGVVPLSAADVGRLQAFILKSNALGSRE
jgi:DNA-binding IclR family transcriptional regulator